jgi:hypothetical protein
MAWYSKTYVMVGCLGLACGPGDDGGVDDTANSTEFGSTGASTGQLPGDGSSGAPTTGTDDSGGSTLDPDLLGEFFRGPIDETAPTTALVIAADGTFSVEFTDCDYGVGVSGTWVVADGGITLLPDTGEDLIEWPIGRFTAQVEVVLAGCGELSIGYAQDSDGAPVEETWLRGQACLTSFDHCCQIDCPERIVPGVLEYCEGTEPECG